MIFNIISNREWIYTQVTVTIKGNTSTTTYDAASHTASGYTVTISDPTYKTSDFAFSGSSSVSRTAAGKTNMGLAASQFTNKNSRYRNVVFNVTDGYVQVNQKAVTVTADNKSKTYGANDPTLTATVSGTLGSDKVTYTLARASGSNVGTYTITPSGNASQGNYAVTFKTGTFTINKAAASALGLSVSGGTYTYNGTARSVSASVSVTSGTTIQYSTNNSSWSTTKPTYTNVGTNTTYVRAVNSNYATATANANIVINKAAASSLGLSVTAYSALYNGSAHTVTAKVTVTSGTTIQYSTDNTNWSTTNPSRTVVGVTTVYVRAVNSNYNTATATSSVTNKCRITVNTKGGASVKFVQGSTTYTATANSSGVATYDVSASGNWTVTSTLGSTSKSGTCAVPTNNAAASIALALTMYLIQDGVKKITWTESKTLNGSITYPGGYVRVGSGFSEGTTNSSATFTSAAVSFTGFTKLHVEFSRTSDISMISASGGSYYNNSVSSVSITTSTSRATEVYDISSRTGDFYIRFTALSMRYYNEAYVAIYNLWLD